MTGNASNAKSEALARRKLSSEELDAVSGGAQSPMQMIKQILQQVQQGQG